VSPVGIFEIYPSALRNTHPRGVPSCAPAPRRTCDRTRSPPPAGPVRTTHRPRGRLGVPGRYHRDLTNRAEKHPSARCFFVRARAAAHMRPHPPPPPGRRRPTQSEPRIGRGGALVSSVGPIKIYPSAPRNTDPRGVPSCAPAPPRHTATLFTPSAPHLSRANPQHTRCRWRRAAAACGGAAARGDGTGRREMRRSTYYRK
jgi:hypothetical protein